MRAKCTKAAHKAHIEGDVVLQFTVNADGSPTNIAVYKSLGYGLDENAVKALSSSRYKPANRAGHPIAMVQSVTFHFRLRKT